MTVQNVDDTTTTTETPNADEQAQQQETALPQPEQEQQGQQPPADGAGSAEEEHKPKRNRVQERIDELTRNKYTAERDAAFWREQAMKGQSSESPPAKPVRSDFDSEEAYFEAIADYKLAQKLDAYRANDVAERQKQAEERETAVKFDLFKERAAQCGIADYYDVVNNNDTPVLPHVTAAILDCEHGPHVAYHLAKNRDLAQRLNGMSPIQAALEIGRLSAQITKTPGESQNPTPTKRTTQAPSPITPVRGSNGQFVKSEADMTDAEWYAKNRK